MRPDQLDLAHRWSAQADEDLQVAITLVGDPGFPRQASYHAQQSAEKSLKAVLTGLGTPFPKTHDLIQLAALLPANHHHRVTLLQCDLATLTTWAVRGRFPETGPAAAAGEAVVAIDPARTIRDVARAWLRSLGGTSHA